MFRLDDRESHEINPAAAFAKGTLPSSGQALSVSRPRMHAASRKNLQEVRKVSVNLSLHRHSMSSQASHWLNHSRPFRHLSRFKSSFCLGCMLQDVMLKVEPSSQSEVGCTPDHVLFKDFCICLLSSFHQFISLPVHDSENYQHCMTLPRPYFIIGMVYSN